MEGRDYGVEALGKGCVLVAAPTLLDPNFHRTVVLLLDYDDGGALGVVLNRPTGTGVDEPVPEWEPLAVEPGVVFVGGPVLQGAAIAIGRVASEVSTPPAPDGFLPLFGALGTVDLTLDPGEVGQLDAVRIFSGYAGWGPGQLEAEIEEGSWVVVDADPDDVFSDDPESLWEQILTRQGGTVAWLAACPSDPSLN